MKKTLITIIGFLVYTHGICSDITISVNNRTAHKFIITGNQNLNCSDCILCTGEQFNYFVTKVIDQKNNPNLIGNNLYFNCGVSGKISFESEEYNRKYKGHIYYNKPYVGDNEYRFNIEPPFRITLASVDKSGNLTFEIEGGPDEVTNIRLLPNRGPRIINKYVTIKDGNPTMPQGMGLSEYFDVTVTAPVSFADAMNGSYEYNDSKGKFCGAQNVGRVTYYELAPTGKDRNIRIEISDLPDGIPLIPTFNIKTGLHFPEPNPKPASASVPCISTQMPNGNTTSASLMPVYSVWFEEVSNDHFQLTGAYACPDMNKTANAATASSGFNAKRQLVINPADWQNNRTVFFNKSSKPVQYNLMKLKQVNRLNKLNISH